MPIPSGIPTSFVPRQPIQAGNRRAFIGGDNLFLIGAVVVAGAALILAGAIFAYDRYLASTLEAKKSELSIEKESVKPETIEEFVRLSQRIQNVRTVLGNHIVLSQFFDVLEAATLQNVKFISLNITVAADNTAKIEGDGTAKNFNTLAAQSNALAAEKNIRRAIFSSITLNENKTVGFKVSAEIDSKLILADNSNIMRRPVDPLTLPVDTITPPVPVAATTTSTLPETTATTTPAVKSIRL